MARLIGGRSKVAIRVWIDEDVAVRLGRHVEELGVSRAEFIRQCVTEALPVVDTMTGIGRDQMGIQPGQRRKHTTMRRPASGAASTPTGSCTRTGART